MPRPSRKQDVLAAASARFFRDGITATGVDAVVADAGVAKMTLYGNFGSKSDLVAAYLEERDRRFFEQWDEAADTTPDPLERALVPVGLYRRYLGESGFHGCAFVNASAELAPDHPARPLIAGHKRRVLSRWSESIAELDVEDAEPLARECFLLLEGGFVQAGLGLGTEPFNEAERLIRARLGAAKGAA